MKQRVCAVSDLAPASAIGVKVAGVDGQTLQLAVVRDADGNWHAINDLCPHGEVLFSEGDVEGCEIECWGHGARVDLATGKATLPITRDVLVYPVSVEGDDVYVEIASK